MAEKLTATQREFLGLLAMGDRKAMTSYRPLNTLIQRGLAERVKSSGLQHAIYRITPNGLDLLGLLSSVPRLKNKETESDAP